MPAGVVMESRKKAAAEMKPSVTIRCLKSGFSRLPSGENTSRTSTDFSTQIDRSDDRAVTRP